MSPEQMVKALDGLLFFCNMQLGDDEAIRIKIHVENVGPYKYLDFQCFLNYDKFCNNEVAYKETFGKHTFLSQLVEDSEDDSEDNDSEKPDRKGLALWVKKMEQLEELMGPKFRLAMISFNNSFNDARGRVSTTAFKSFTTS